MYNEKAKYTVKVSHNATTNHYSRNSRKLFRKRKYKISVMEIIKIVVLYVIPITVLTWLFFSWLDVIFNNLTTFEYAKWNAFNLFNFFN